LRWRALSNYPGNGSALSEGIGQGRMLAAESGLPDVQLLLLQ